MEGTRQTVLILNAHIQVADRVYQLIRDSSCHDFNLILVDSKSNLEKYFNNNNIAIIIMCVSDLATFQDSAQKIANHNRNLPLLCVLPSPVPPLMDFIQEQEMVDPLLISQVDECFLLKNIFYAIERSHIAQEIKNKDAILKSVNFAAESFLNHADWKTYIKEVLQKIAEASRADSVAVFENVKNEDGSINSAKLVDYWMDEEDSVLKFTKTGVVYTFEQLGMADYVHELTTTRHLQANVKALPQKTQSVFNMIHVKSILIISIFTNGDWWGFFRFDQCRQEREWKQVEIDALHTASSILSAAVTRQKTDNRLKYLATHDYLTNLPNRLLYEDHLDSAILRSQRSKKWVGLYVIDLDHFKKVNDMHGHPFGDKVLIEVGKRLQEAIRASDTVARIGGDEFVVLGEDLSSAEDINRVAEKILSSFVQPISCDNFNIQIYPSIGISIYPINGNAREELMRNADIALYKAKKQGNTYVVSEIDPEKQLWLDNLQDYGS